MSELPFLESALTEAAHRRYGRAGRRRALPGGARVALAAVALGAIAIALVTLAGRAGVDEERPAPSPATRPATPIADAERGFEGALPAGWRLASESLTPKLTDPRELFAAGTFELRYREADCNHLPVGALRGLGPQDGFVTVLERGRMGPSGRAAFPERGRALDRAKAEPIGDAAQCRGGAPTGQVEYWIPFRDAGRAFYAFVVLGRRAPAEVRDQAFAILRGLRFDPGAKPGWRSSG